MYSGVRGFNNTLYDRTTRQLNPVLPIRIKVIKESIYRLQEIDFGFKLLFTSSDPVTVYIGKNIVSAKNIGHIIICKQKGTGQITFGTDTGVTLESPDGDTKTRVQYSEVSVIVEPDGNGYCATLVGDLTT